MEELMDEEILFTCLSFGFWNNWFAGERGCLDENENGYPIAVLDNL